MKISNLIHARYISRPNRFTIEFEYKDNKIEKAHLHDPGRLKELLIKNTDILIRYVPDYEVKKRKTKYDMIAIKYNNEWVLLNSSFHNTIVSEIINNKQIEEIENFYIYKPEYSYGNSRLDFLLKNNEEEELFLEVKGCTLVENKIAKFPDAPTKRGKKHLEELIKISEKSLKSAVIILILQNNANIFSPNYNTDKEFSETLKKAYDNNVKIYPVRMKTCYKENNLFLTYDKILPISFE